MAEESKSVSSQKKRSEKKKEKSEPAEQFSISHFIERTEYLDAEDIKIDRELTKGQVRPISESNVKDLEEFYAINEPDELMLTVSQDRGSIFALFLCVPSCVLSLLLVSFSFDELT